MTSSRSTRRVGGREHGADRSEVRADHTVNDLTIDLRAKPMTSPRSAPSPSERGPTPRSGRIERRQTQREGAATMKLTTVTHVSVDGVMQGLGGPDEDRRGGFERGGWALPLFADEAATFVNQVFQRADAFLFGRRTYEIFAGSWGTWEDPGDSPIWTALNTKPKYVASTTLSDPRWADTKVLSGDLAPAI